MQCNSLYLYTNKLDIFTEVANTWSAERYRRVYNRNLKIYRSVDNKVDLQVRNNDQKATNITGYHYVVSVTSATGVLVLTKDCDPHNLTTGKLSFVLTQAELFDMEPGYYTFSVIQETRQSINANEFTVTSSRPTYVDSQYGVNGTLHVLGDVKGTVKDSIVIDKFSYTNPATLGEMTPKYYVSSIIDAQPQLETPQSLHTFQFYFTNYTGTVQIQASNEEQGGTPQKWIDVALIDPAVDVYKNITGKWSWFRIKHFPLSGTLDKVLYR